MKITVGGQKGGIGKTTTAVLLACAAARAGSSVLLVDADPTSQSAFDWASLAIAAGDTFPAIVQPWATADLARRVRTIEHEYDVVVIDTGGGNAEMLRAALSVAPELVIPVRPNAIEIRRIPATLAIAREVAQLMETEIYPRVLFVGVNPQAADEGISREFLGRSAIPVFDEYVRSSVLYPRQFGITPKSVGAYEAVYAELCRRVAGDDHAGYDPAYLGGEQ